MRLASSPLAVTDASRRSSRRSRASRSALAEPGQQRRERRLARGRSRCASRSPSRREVQAHGAAVGRIGLARDQALGFQALDDPHPARVAEAEHAAQRVDRRAVGEGLERGEDGGARQLHAGGLAHAVADDERVGAQQVGGARAHAGAWVTWWTGPPRPAPSAIASSVATAGRRAAGTAPCLAT